MHIFHKTLEIKVGDKVAEGVIFNLKDSLNESRIGVIIKCTKCKHHMVFRLLFSLRGSLFGEVFSVKVSQI